MLSVVTLNDKDGNPVILHDDSATGKRWLTSALGLRGIANLRTSQRVRSQAHGSINETRFESGREITLVGEIMSQIGLEDAFGEWGEVMEPMIQTLDYGPALLKWQEGDTGNSLQMLVTIDGDLLPPFQDGASTFSYQATLFSEDPRAYDQNLQTVTCTPLSVSGGGLVLDAPFPWTFASSGGGTINVAVNGNRSTPPVFKVYGTITNPQIVVVGTGTRLAFNGTIGASSYLEIDVAARTVQLVTGGFATNRLDLYDSADSTWFELPSGTTTNLQLIAGEFDSSAKFDVIFRDAWA
jgi:Phage tail protein